MDWVFVAFIVLFWLALLGVARGLEGLQSKRSRR